MPQITFIGVMTATTADYMSYMIWRPVLLHDVSRDVLIVRSKRPNTVLAFTPRHNDDWMLVYGVDDPNHTDIPEMVAEDATARTDALNGAFGAQYYASWRI